MESSLYVSLSGQVALQKRLDTIANNVANAATNGFRAENVTFDSIISNTTNASITYSGPGRTTFSESAGPLIQTQNPLDIAARGDAFFAIATPNGTVYTRDGRLRISQSGELETITGYPILDDGGAPIQINPNNGQLSISVNGAISQSGTRVGTIGLFKLASDSRLQRGEGAGIISDKPAEPVVDYSVDGVVQGHLEGANVNPVLEITRLIAVTRAFESISSTIDKSDGTMKEAIRTLGSGR